MADHKHRYKNMGLSADELRKRREEEGIQLRKQKREQQLFKRRNVNLQGSDDPETSLQVGFLGFPIHLPSHEQLKLHTELKYLFLL